MSVERRDFVHIVGAGATGLVGGPLVMNIAENRLAENPGIVSTVDRGVDLGRALIDINYMADLSAALYNQTDRAVSYGVTSAVVAMIAFVALHPTIKIADRIIESFDTWRSNNKSS